MIANNCNEDQPTAPHSSPMEIILPGNITPEPLVEFSNYDILLMPCESDKPLRFAPGNHVGNQRFRVLLSLHRQRYLQADERSDEEECTRIALEVMEIVSQKCVPNGRFYEQIHCDQLQELQLGPSTVAIIKSSLKNEPKDGLHSEERSPKRFFRQFGSEEPQAILQTGEPKRFFRRVSTESEPETVTSPNPFDVICGANGLHLRENCQHTGNKRLKVMLNMRMMNYKRSDLVGKQTIAQEVVNSIMNDASSQFLRVHGTTGMYKPISRELATTCMRNTLDAAATKGGKKTIRKSEINKLMERKKNKAVLRRFECRKGSSGKSHHASSLPTKFKSFGKVDMNIIELIGQDAAIRNQ
ncbi:hypothetical protein ACHAXR_005573 [Thalassiosira sp. AJA248-18]